MEDYYLGLSMGTKDVGWAVTDPCYRLIRKKGKDAWGVRKFDEASGTAEMRGFRTQRRLKQRAKERIEYVKSVFADAVNAVDPDFYHRLEESRFSEEDKTITQPYALFADPGFTDKDYYAKYPTMSHLRSELIHSCEEHDVRLVCLAVINIFKHRGHFLNASLSDDDLAGFEETYAALAESCANLPSVIDMEEVKNALTDDKVSNSRRYYNIAKLLGITSKMPEADMLKLVCGLKGAVAKMFPEHVFDSEYKKYSFSFRDTDYEEKDTKLAEILATDEYDFIQLIKHAHDWCLLANIMQGEQYLSDGRLLSYKKHAEDLAVLKAVYKRYDEKGYNKMFRVMSDHNYSSYIGSVDSRFEKKRRGAKGDKDGLYKKISSDIAKMKETHPDDAAEDMDIVYVLEEIANGTFLPKQLTVDNRVIPCQAHLKELKAILQNAEGYLPFLKETDESGLSASERLIQLFSFQIPYYIGPLYNDGDPSHNAWIVRKEPGKVYPWNFEDKVDVKASSEAFIGRMVGECSFLPGEKVLPKCSMLYERYMVLNELNKLRVNGDPVSVELKKGTYNDLFRKNRKVTLNKIKDYIVKNGIMAKGDIYEVSGVNGEFKASLTSYRFFCDVLGTKALTADQEKMAEQIIFWSTVYGDSKQYLTERISETYGNVLTVEQIYKICGARFKDWGSLSEKLLMVKGEKRGVDEESPLTIIERMWEENVNIMECLGSGYTYRDIVQSMADTGQRSLQEITHDDLDELYITAPVRRMLWQTILVVREVIGVMGKAPLKVVLEVGKSANVVNKKQRALNRKKWLLERYKGKKDKTRDWYKEIDAIPARKFLSKK